MRLKEESQPRLRPASAPLLMFALVPLDLDVGYAPFPIMLEGGEGLEGEIPRRALGIQK